LHLGKKRAFIFVITILGGGLRLRQVLKLGYKVNNAINFREEEQHEEDYCE
jgi:hypothetical protein